MNKLEEIDEKVTEIRSILENFIERNHVLLINRRLSMDEVSEAVGVFFNVSLKQMRADSREGHIMKARHMARYIMLTEFHYTVPQVSDFIGCTRATTYNTIYRTENWLSTDEHFKRLHMFVMEAIAEKSCTKAK